MNREMAEKIAAAVLYEGYMLYPYRPSAVKNQQRWNFGTLYPAGFDEVARGTERAALHAECLLQSNIPDPQVTIRLRFLQYGTRPDAAWDEAVERAAEMTVNASDVRRRMTFSFPSSTESIAASLTAQFEKLPGNTTKLSIDLRNEFAGDSFASREDVLRRSLISAHLLLCAEGADFVSLLDPGEDLRETAAGCKNVGVFPVLVGDEGQRKMLLCSPIILYDYPQIAPESAGDFFDGTEMDEMLTLRVMTLSDPEKEEMRSADERVRTLLERTEQSAREQLMRTHGVIRGLRAVNGNE